MKDLIKNFNKATADIKAKEKIELKVCSFCKKPTADWVQSITYNNGTLVENLTYVICGKCLKKRTKKN